MNFTEDVPKYRKKSTKKPPKKAKHKHLCEPCVIERPADLYKKEHERSGEIKPDIYSYCPICGKIGDFRPDKDRWYTTVRRQGVAFSFLETVPTEEGARELNPATRTLPTFRVYEYCPKTVDLEDST